MSKLIIGLTGGIGSGKTTVTNLFAEKGIDIVDADVIARDVVAPKSKALIAIEEHFGKEIIQTDGQLNRALLRKIIFSGEDDKRWLNNLLHPLIRSEIIKSTQTATSSYCLLVAPLLIENNLMKLVDRVLVIDVTEDIQLERALNRDQASSKEEIESIMASQISRALRMKSATDIIDNSGNKLINVRNKVNELHKLYTNLCKIKQNNRIS